MKKSFLFLMSFFLVSVVSAESVAVVNNSWTLSSTWKVLEISEAKTWNWENVLVNPVEKTTYTYYYGETCPYCQRLTKYLNQTWWFEKLKIEKKEVWHNKKNAEEMSKDITRLKLEDKKIWVPFLVVNNGWKETYLSGLDEAMNHFEPILWKVETKTVENKQAVKYFLIIALILAIWIPTFFIIFKK